MLLPFDFFLARDEWAGTAILLPVPAPGVNLIDDYGNFNLGIIYPDDVRTFTATYSPSGECICN